MSNYYKLYYFDSRGDAEVIRIIFAQADVKYRDFRFEGDQWMNEYKAKMPFGRVPVLDVNHPLGPKISGSLNILRYLGNKFGMSGKDTLSDAMLGGASDFMNDINTQLVTMRQAKDEDKVKVTAEFKERTVPEMLRVLQKNVINGHIVGSEKLSWVDIQAYQLLDNLKNYFCINLTDYPELQRLYNEVATQPNIKRWLETRPKTEH